MSFLILYFSKKELKFMSQENYSKNEIDLKFDNLEQKINSSS